MRSLIYYMFYILVCGCFALANVAKAQEDTTLKVGIIGLDTSHSSAFAKDLNKEPPNPDMHNCRVTIAYPHGSRDIESSASRIPGYTESFKMMGIEIADSIDALLKQVDCVLLETNDGRLHLEQAVEVFKAGKPVFIDKPLGSNLAEVIAIFEMAKKYDVPMFSSSSLRFTEAKTAIRNGSVGKVLGCDAYSPCSLEPTHVDLFWYGIHGVESLYTCMGVGCETVVHTSTSDFELAVGKWSDGRIGTFRGIRKGASGYGGMVFGEKGIKDIGPYAGYTPMLVEVTKFFRSHEPPVSADETIELHAFMQAAFESKKQGGIPISIADVMAKAKADAAELLKKF